MTPQHRWVSTLWPSVVGIVLMVLCAGPLRQQWAAGDWSAARAADAKPLFLAARAVRLGADPLDPAVLQNLAAQAGMREGGGSGTVRSADPRRGADKGGAYASMYPVTAAVVLQPLRPDAWSDFVAHFRALGFVMLVAGAGAAGAAGAGRRRMALLGAGLGLCTLMWIAPPIAEPLGVAQANVHIAGLTGLSLGALALGWMGLFGALVVVGGGVKLLPLGLLGPALAGRYWRALWVAAVTTGVLLGVAAGVAPLQQILGDVVESVRYQGAVAPKWVLRDAPRPAFVLFHLRQGVLGAVTAGLALCLLLPARSMVRVRERGGWQELWTTGAPRADVVAAAALVAAWLAVLGAGSQRIYAVLQVPVWAWLAGSMAAPHMRWWTRLATGTLILLVVLPGWLDSTGIDGWDGRAVVLLGAWIAWGAVAVRAVMHGWRAWGLWRRLAVVALAVWLAGVGGWWSQLAPSG